MMLFIAPCFIFIFLILFLQRIYPKLSYITLLKSLLTWPPFTPRAAIPDTETKILQDIKPYVFPPLKLRTSKRMTMGLNRLDEANWLTLDSNYLPENAIRKNFLLTSCPAVLQYKPIALPGCYELLDHVTTFLSTRFPQHFQISTSSTTKEPMIHNHLTGESFIIGPKCEDPMGIAARLAMEDFNILMRDEQTGEYLLQASATLFPAGWKLEDRIGTSMENLHKPVPGWQGKLGGSVNRYFDHLNAKTSMERYNLFIQTTPHLFQDSAAPPKSSPSQSSSSSSSPPSSSSPIPDPITTDKLMVRRERQTFRRLPITGGVLFTVRTYLVKLTDLGDDELRALRSQILGWDEQVKVYKGWREWGDLVLGYVEGRVGPLEVEETKVESESESEGVKVVGKEGNAV